MDEQGAIGWQKFDDAVERLALNGFGKGVDALIDVGIDLIAELDVEGRVAERLVVDGKWHIANSRWGMADG